MEDILAVVFIFGGGTLILMAFSPIGKALAERIRGRPAAPPDPGVGEETLAEVQELRREVAELAERVDFVERLQAKPRDAERLARGST